MKKMFERTLAVLLCALLMCCAVPVLAASAETYSGTCGDNVTWSFDTETGTLTIAGEGEMADYDDDNSAPWASHRQQIRTVVIKSGVKRIGAWAFGYCENMTGVMISTGVEMIGRLAFHWCARLLYVVIPSSVTRIETGAFAACTGLTRIDADTRNPTYCSDENGALYNKSKTELIQYPVGRADTMYVIPDGVKTIGDGAFFYSKYLTGVVVSESVTSIGVQAFAGSASLLGISIPNGTVRIGDKAFEWCTNLSYVHIPASVSQIGKDCFHECSAVICSDSADCYAKTYAEQNDVTFVVCSGHETNPVQTPTVAIHGYVPTKTVDFRTSITFTAVKENAPEGSKVHWFINGSDTGANETYVAQEVRKDFTVQAKLMQGNTVLGESEIETVKVNSDFFSRLFAFFQWLFGRLPVVAQEYLGAKEPAEM